MTDFLLPLQHLHPATRVQFGLGAMLQYSSTPSLRLAGFEDSLPDVASLSFRRWGDVGRTTMSTRTKRLVRAGWRVAES
ncbi:MAG TPA: hypothetical protein VE641_09915, partial [Chthoniobacterales bacterium]|nr:hypothetical protein [Chthoniobacterales bacterium]